MNLLSAVCRATGHKKYNTHIVQEPSSYVKLTCVFVDLSVGGDVCLYRNTFLMRDV